MRPQPDVRPELKGPQFAAWIFFVFSYITGVFSATIAGLIALGLGVIRKGGMPSANQAYLQSIVLDENVQLLGFLGVASSAGSLSLICWGPIFIHAACVCVWIANDQSHVTGLYSKLIALVQKTGLIAKLSANQAHMWTLRHDLEVYMGLYLTFGIFIGLSSILTTLLYWQIMRMRYLMSPACQQAYVRFDAAASQKLASRWCPGVFSIIYIKIRSFLKG